MEAISRCFERFRCQSLFTPIVITGTTTYLFLGVHTGETTAVAGLASLGGDGLDLLVRAVGEVAGVVARVAGAVAGLAALGGDGLDLFLGAGEIRSC